MFLQFFAELKSLISGDLVRLGIVHSAAFVFEHSLVLAFARRAAKLEAMHKRIYSGINVVFFAISVGQALILSAKHVF